MVDNTEYSVPLLRSVPKSAVGRITNTTGNSRIPTTRLCPNNTPIKTVLVALRVDTADGKHLEFELGVCLALNSGTGSPRVRWQGEDTKTVALLRPSLEDLFQFYGRKFNSKTSLILADQMFARIVFQRPRARLASWVCTSLLSAGAFSAAVR